MFRKFITGIITLTLLGQTGCYTSTQITLDEWIESGETGDVSVTTNDELIYEFYEYYYILSSDSLYGDGIEFNKNGMKRNFEGSIYIDDIHTVEIKEFNTVQTVTMVVLFFGSIYAFYLFVKSEIDIFESH